MARMFGLVLMIALPGMGVGCQHMAGVCDCEAGPYNHAVAGVAAAEGGAVKTAEPPKATEKAPIQAASDTQPQ